MRLVTTFIQNTESTDPDLSYLNRARFVLSVADGHGSDGVGILDAVIRNRHLFLSMTSGAEIDAGSVFTEDDLPVASDSRLGIAAFDPAYFSILAGKVSLRGDLDFGLNETQLAEYLTANKYATQAWVAAQGFIGSDGLALYATKEWVLGQNFAKASSLGNYLLKSVWDEVFEVTTVNGVRVLNVKLDIAGLKGISAYGLGSTSGGGASGSLGELVNVGQWADEVPTADRVMVQLAGTTHWSAKPLADLVGLDTAALAQYLTANSYLKASDISSYLTWANLSGKPTVYPTSWELVADKPTVYPTAWTSVTGRPTKLSQFTDDVVAGNYLPKPTWDAVFEVVTVDGTPVLKVKYDILGLKGITAYADGSLSGGFSGALVDLVDVAVTNLASGDILKYNGTHFVNVPVSSIAGASSWDQITGKPEYYPTRWADVSGAPTSLPASDVYPWAKAASKPTYTAAEVGALALSGGTLTGNVITIGSFILANSGAYPQLTFRATADNSERLLFRHGNDLKWRYNGTNDGIIYHSGNFNPGNYLLLSGGTMTGDISFGSNGRSLRGSDGGNIAGVLYDTPNARYVTAIGTGSRRLILVSPASIYRGAGGVAENYMIYDSGNFNPSSKLDKSVWDEAFELKTVNGVRVISAKLDFLSVAGISAYATGPSSGGGGGGLDYDLLKQALTGAITPDGYPFTISASFLGVIDKTYLTGKLANTYADKVHTHLWTDITDRPTALPANGGNADTVDNLHGSSFTRADQAPDVDLNTVNGQGIMACRANTTATAERHYPIQQAGTLFYGTAAYNSACQIYGTFQYNRWFVRGGGTSPTAKTAWAEIWTTVNFNPDNYLPLSGGKTITGDFQFQDGVAVRDATGKNVVGLLDVAGDGVCVAVGNGVKKTRIVTPNDTPVYRNDGKGAYRIYDSSNFNPDNYLLKTANAVSASKWATARTLTLTGSASGNVSMDGSANVSLSVTNNRLNSNSEMTYGWNGINYFNLAGTAGAVAKTNDTPTTAWWHILRFNHGNSAGYYTDLAVPFNDNTLYYKRVTSGTLHNGGWVKIWDEKNANLSTVDWAAKNITAAGTVTAPTFVGDLSGSASLVNGYDINSFTGYYKYTIDASSLDQNTYYPVTVNLGSFHTVRISVIVALNSGTKPAWSTHASGFSVRFIEEVNGSGWGISVVSRNILANEYGFANANPVGRVEHMTNSSTEVIWVRGGGKYFFYLSIPYITPALRTSTFTTSNQSVSPRTDTMDLRTSVSGSGIAVNKLYAHNSIEINGFTIDVYNGALRVNGNLVATGGVTSIATA